MFKSLCDLIHASGSTRARGLKQEGTKADILRRLVGLHASPWIETSSSLLLLSLLRRRAPREPVD